jgi:hypothetical protein
MENWIYWILLSSFDYFKTKVSSETTKLYISAQETIPDQSVNRFELTFLGPDFLYLPNNETKAVIRFNLLTLSNKDPDDLMFHYKLLGKSLSFFDRCIPIYRYGKNNDQSQFGQLQINTEIKITDILMFDPVSQQQRSTVEAEYSMVISEET